MACNLHGRNWLHCRREKLVALSDDTYLLRVPVSYSVLFKLRDLVVPHIWKEHSSILPLAQLLVLGLVRLLFLSTGSALGRYVARYGAKLIPQSFPLPPTIGSILGYSVAGAICWTRCALEAVMADS
jgi:hypothetical protein